jgi:hypothetical protein
MGERAGGCAIEEEGKIRGSGHVRHRVRKETEHVDRRSCIIHTLAAEVRVGS